MFLTENFSCSIEEGRGLITLYLALIELKNSSIGFNCGL
jgi:hypothetical protein